MYVHPCQGWLHWNVTKIFDARKPLVSSLPYIIHCSFSCFDTVTNSQMDTRPQHMHYAYVLHMHHVIKMHTVHCGHLHDHYQLLELDFRV